MATKNKGGREVRKPKQDKKVKGAGESLATTRLEIVPARKPRHTK